MLTMILNNMVYRIITGHGLSARTYQTDALRRILGTGQGSCASPSIWVAVLDPILWSIATKFTCFQIDTPLNKTIDRIGDAYVDDTSLMATFDSLAANSTVAEVKLTAHTEKIAQDFKWKLFSTGGRLNLKKCFWYLISWRWNSDGTSSMATKDQSPGILQMTQGYKILEKYKLRE